jgi:hypothetical protein
MEQLTGDFDDKTFGTAALALSLMKTNMKIPFFLTGHRPLGMGPAASDMQSTDSAETLTPNDVGQKYADRLFALEAKEASPKTMSHVLRLYGLEPRAAPNEQFVP